MAPLGAASAIETPVFVDLDGTLIRTDLLHEALFFRIKKNPFVLLLVLVWFVRGGHAFVKERLCSGYDVDAPYLPYNADVVAYITQAKIQGRQIFLATAAHRSVATQIARHLNIFDGIIATDAAANRKGCAKLAAIEAAAAGAPFEYLGNSGADLPIWRKAAVAGIVTARSGVAALAERLAPASYRLGPQSRPWRSFLRALRPHQWVKNVLIFVPLLSSHRIFDVPALVVDAETFVAFSLVASATYLINDLCDLAADRRHDSKRFRPFASGELAITIGIAAIPILLAAAFAIAIVASAQGAMVLLMYLFLSLAYSFAFKKVAILDIIVLAGLYTARIIAGFVVANVRFSFWLLVFSLFIFVSLALMKRCSELHNLRRKSLADAHGRGYVTEDYEQLTALGSASGYISVLILALYVNSADVVLLYRHALILWGTCPIMLYWVGRAWLIAHRGQMSEDPIVFALRDVTSYVCVGLCAICAVAATVL